MTTAETRALLALEMLYQDVFEHLDDMPAELYPAIELVQNALGEWYAEREIT